MDQQPIANNNNTPPLAGKREWIGLAVIALPCMLYSMDLTVLNLAVPQLSADLKPSSSELLWIIDIYGFMIAGMLITMGTLGDRIGRRRLLMIGSAAFGIASVIAAFSTSAEMLIATRALLGIAGATLAPSTLSLIRNMFLDTRQRTVAVGVWIASYSVGGAIGPLLGGLLLEYFWWGSVFLVGVPVMVLLLILGPRLLPEFKDEHAGRLDFISAALSLFSVLLIIYGLKQIAEKGAEWPSFLSIAAGLVLGFVFLRRQRTLPDPLIDLQLFGKRSFSMLLVANLLGVFIMFGSYVFISQYLQLVLGLSPMQAGLWTLPWSVGFIVGSLVAPLIIRKFQPVSVLAAGFLISAAGFGVVIMADGNSGLVAIVTGSLIFSLGLAPVFTLLVDMIVGSAPPERAGAASALSETSSELGGALGIAILGSIGTAVYRSQMVNAVPAEISATAAEAAKGTLGGALAVAETLTAGSSIELVNTARNAFANGLQLASIISVTVAITLAVLIMLFFRRTYKEASPTAN
jgi:DHA2 family multidrug resistance protein-like MFS transporter